MNASSRTWRNGSTVIACSACAMELFPTLPMPLRTMMRGPLLIVARPELSTLLAYPLYPRACLGGHRLRIDRSPCGGLALCNVACPLQDALPFAKRRYHRHPWQRGGASPRADEGRPPMTGEKPGEKPESTAQPAEPAPHYHGHRQRLRQRFLAAGSEAVSDYEVL